MKKLKEQLYAVFEFVMPAGMVGVFGCGLLVFYAGLLAIPAAIITLTIYFVLHMLGVV